MKYYHALLYRYVYGYFVLLIGQDCEVIGILALFQIISGQNLGISTTGVAQYRANPHR